MTGRDPTGPMPDPDTDSSLGSTQGDDATLTDGEPMPSDQGGLSTDEGSQSEHGTDEDLSIADGERESVQPNDGRPVTDEYGRTDPRHDPMGNDNR